MISADSALSGLDFPAAFQRLKLIRTCSPRVSPRLRASASRSIPPTRCNPDPDGTVGVPSFTEHANLDFPSFQSLPDPKGRNCPAAVLYRKCRSGPMHHLPARSTACPGATQRECTTSLRHKSLRNYRKPQKNNALTLYEKFSRISQFASPTPARCNPAGTPPALRPALGCTGHSRNLFDWRPLRRQLDRKSTRLN